MTRLFHAGPGVPHHTLGEFDPTSDGTGLTWDTTIVRLGPYAARYSAGGYLLKTFAPVPQGCTTRAYIRLNATPGARGTLMGMDDASGNILCTLSVRPDLKLELNIDGYPTPELTLATSTFTVPVGTFDCHELWCQAMAPRLISARFNGTEWARVVPLGFGVGDAPVGEAYWGATPASPAIAVHYTDMAVNSLDGTSNNGWCGLSGGGVLTFWPTADTGELTSWTVQGGGPVYAALDEIVPDDAATYIKETAGVLNAVAGFYFPVWPVRTPASSVLFGIRGGGTDVTSRLAALFFVGPSNLIAQGSTVDWNLNGFKTVYPALTLEEAMDGTRRLLSNGYLYPTPHPGFIISERARANLIRLDGVAREIRISAVWMTVDFPYASPAASAPAAIAPQPTILATIDPA